MGGDERKTSLGCPPHTTPTRRPGRSSTPSHRDPRDKEEEGPPPTPWRESQANGAPDGRKDQIISLDCPPFQKFPLGSGYKGRAQGPAPRFRREEGGAQGWSPSGEQEGVSRLDRWVLSLLWVFMVSLGLRYILNHHHLWPATGHRGRPRGRPAVRCAHVSLPATVLLSLILYARV